MNTYNFFLDIDDTLIPQGEGKISEENISAIKKARSLGCRFFINTGRPFCDIDKTIFSYEYFDGICSGGDYVQYNGKPIYSSFLPKEDAKSLLTALMSMGKNINFNIGGLRSRYYIGKKMPHYSDKIYRLINSINELDTVFDGDELQKYSLCQSGEPDTEVRREIERYFSVITHPTYTEGFLNGHDKAFLIKKTEEALGLAHENTVAIGDSLNDTDMLGYAAVSVAMGNAHDAVKSICTFVTDTSERSGVAKAILRLISE